jgi:FkbM family methyltransferase
VLKPRWREPKKLAEALAAANVDGVVQVGLGLGQEIAELRTFLPPGLPWLGFEPVADFRDLLAPTYPGEIVPLALADEPGERTLYVRREQTSLMAFGSRRRGHRRRLETVVVSTLDREISLRPLWQERRNLFLQIDVQGAELEVVRGASETLAHCAVVMVEMHKAQALEPTGTPEPGAVVAAMPFHRFIGRMSRFEWVFARR